MSEDNEGAATGPEGAGFDPFATTMALDGASRAKADAFLQKQGRLVDLQCEYLADKDQFELSHLRWRRFTEQMKGALQALTAMVGIAVAVGIGLMLWQAAHSDGLRVEPFSVPPGLAANGLTGQVVAARLIDRLSELQSQTNTGRPARTYTDTWGDKAIKLEIPETGISLEELDSWLRAKLGHETPLSGEVVRTASGVVLTARAGTDGAISVSGAEADMTMLTSRLAEGVYRLTQPYRYAIYLMRHEKRPADAAEIFKGLALHGGPEERRWSYNMWANATEVATHDFELGLRMYRKAHQADPDAIQPMSTLGQDLSRFGRLEEARQIRKEGLAIVQKTAPGASAIDLPDPVNYFQDLIAATAVARSGVRGISPSVLVRAVVSAQIGLHDLSAARANLAEIPSDVDLDLVDKKRAELRIAVEAEDWHGVLASAGEMTDFLKTYPNNRHYVLVSLAPLLALARAHLGDLAAAERTIALTPGDCDPCIIVRAQIAERAGQRARSDFWFARAAAQAPSFPFAFLEWGRALLARAKPDEAIEKFRLANQEGPHFADPLEGWGEALMAKSQSHLALAKFAEAEKYAPNWGRLHLKWGEALGYAGKLDEAKQQFARAAQLDLAPSEKAELAHQSPHA